jgi:glycosyltransferase involved in cell wall biosynthesis
MISPRLLYLGFALPPGMSALYPELTPAGHLFETQMVAGLRRFFEMRTVTQLPVSVSASEARGGGDGGKLSPGVVPEVVLLDRPPEVYHRWRALRQLRRSYRQWEESGWVPEVVLAYNLPPVYTHFCRWLRSARRPPKRVLLLADSSRLGQALPRFKALRYRFKPLFIPDEQALGYFDACIGLSRSAEGYCQSRGIPWLWMPGGCDPRRAAPEEGQVSEGGPIRFGYFGSLADYAGLPRLIRLFRARPGENTLDICGYGKAAPAIADQCRQDPRIKFHGLLAPEALQRVALGCDVLINPRPLSHGNENNFPSKVFEYALIGRAILTSRLSGIELVLGPEAYYFEATDFERGLSQLLDQLAQVPRTELRRRGRQVQQHVVAHYSWEAQAERISRFLTDKIGAE